MDRKSTSLRRKLRLSIFIICILGIWLKNVYDDKSFIEGDIDLYKISLSDKDTVVMGLYKQIDSLKKLKRRAKTVFVFPKREFKRKIIDSVPNIKVEVDTNRVIEDVLEDVSDTLK